MGGRGSGGGRGGGGGGTSSGTQISKETENKIDYLMNQSYKHDDDAYDYNRQAQAERAMAKEFRKKGKLKSAEKYEEYAKESQKKAKASEAKAKEFRKQANELAPKEVINIPRTYQYKGEKGVRRVYKSPQAAKERWIQAHSNTVSTAYADSPTIVQTPKGGYSIVPHKIAKMNKLKEISPYRISD